MTLLPSGLIVAVVLVLTKCANHQHGRSRVGCTISSCTSTCLRLSEKLDAALHLRHAGDVVGQIPDGETALAVLRGLICISGAEGAFQMRSGLAVGLMMRQL